MRSSNLLTSRISYPANELFDKRKRVANGILEHIGRFIDEKRTVYRVPHTVNAVPALHEGYIPERTHNIIPDRHECVEPNGAGGMEVRRADNQSDALVSKSIPRDNDLIAFPLKIRVGELDMEGLYISNQLYGAVFGLFRLMHRRNDSKCLLL